jgi:N-acyl-D-glutamate deacylase
MPQSKPWLALASIALLSAALALKARNANASPDDTTYDVVIANGHVMDPESGLDAVRNVGITGGKVRALSTEPLKGKSTLDAKNLVVAPGFIDLHEHG